MILQSCDGTKLMPFRRPGPELRQQSLSSRPGGGGGRSRDEPSVLCWWLSPVVGVVIRRVVVRARVRGLLLLAAYDLDNFLHDCRLAISGLLVFFTLFVVALQ